MCSRSGIADVPLSTIQCKGVYNPSTPPDLRAKSEFLECFPSADDAFKFRFGPPLIIAFLPIELFGTWREKAGKGEHIKEIKKIRKKNKEE